jgi:hypothetical protein
MSVRPTSTPTESCDRECPALWPRPEADPGARSNRTRFPSRAEYAGQPRLPVDDSVLTPRRTVAPSLVPLDRRPRHPHDAADAYRRGRDAHRQSETPAR